MANYDGSLPVKTQVDADERVQTKVVDYTVPTQGQSVDTQGRSHVKPIGNDPGGTQRIIRTSERGSTSVDGVYSVSNNTVPSNVGLVGATRAASPADTDQIKRLTAITNGNSTALDVSVLDSLGAAISESNPLPVFVADSTGTEVNDYKQASAIAKDATDNHDYTVTALKTLILTQVVASGSGRLFMTLSIETGVATGVFTNKLTLWISVSNPIAQFSLREVIRVAAGVRVRVAVTNKDNQASDLYSTICGHEVP